MCLVELDEWARVSAQVATAPTVAAGARILCRALALTLGRPIALLSRDAEGWHFEAEGFPDGHSEPTLTLPSLPEPLADPDGIRDSTGQAWTGVAVGELSGRQWMLMLPGAADHWSNLAGIGTVHPERQREPERMAERDEEAYLSRFNRRLYAFSRRLARDSDSAARAPARTPHARRTGRRADRFPVRLSSSRGRPRHFRHPRLPPLDRRAHSHRAGRRHHRSGVRVRASAPRSIVGGQRTCASAAVSHRLVHGSADRRRRSRVSRS